MYIAAFEHSDQYLTEAHYVGIGTMDNLQLPHTGVLQLTTVILHIHTHTCTHICTHMHIHVDTHGCAGRQVLTHGKRWSKCVCVVTKGLKASPNYVEITADLMRETFAESDRSAAELTVKLGHLGAHSHLAQYCLELGLVHTRHKPSVHVPVGRSELRLQYLHAYNTEQNQAFLQEDILCIIYIVLMRDEKEGRKKQARSNKQQGKATQHTQGSHFS